jgi:rhamnulose-1-phosphate aldolase
MVETMLDLRDHEMVVWSQHGVMVRSDDSIFHGLDLIEYAEAAAHYECLNLLGGDLTAGITSENLRAIANSVKIDQTIF